MLERVPYSSLSWLFTLAVSAFIHPSIARGQSDLSDSDTPEAEALRYIADGSQMYLSEVDLTITPPQGWQVIRDFPGMTLVLQPQAADVEVNKDRSKTKFQKNITLVTRKNGVPMDQRTADKLQLHLEETMQKDGLVSEFQVLERKFLSFQSGSDALMFYTSMKLDGFNMMQLHLLVSGSDRHYLLTYTDLQDSFAKQDDWFQTAWAVMTSVQVSGEAPKRYEKLLKYSGLLAVILSLAMLLRRRAQKRRLRYYEELGTEIYSDSGEWSDGNASLSSFQTGVWVIDGGAQEKGSTSSYHSVSNYS